jgi:hypothetical protein
MKDFIFKWLIYFSILAQPFLSWLKNLNGNIGEVAIQVLRTISLPGWIALL